MAYTITLADSGAQFKVKADGYEYDDNFVNFWSHPDAGQYRKSQVASFSLKCPLIIVRDPD